MAITVSRVAALPATPAADTIYLVADGSDRIRIVVTGATGAVIRSSAGWSETTAAIDSAVATAKTEAVADAKTYTDSAISTLDTDLRTEINIAESAAEFAATAAAKTYTDGQVAAVTTAFRAGDTSVTTTLRSELALEIATALTTAAATADTKIAAAVAGLEMSTVAELAATIAARNALTPTKNIFCLVQDATGDATVSLGAALYFYNFSTTTWTKVCEYESMDVIIPNKAIIEKFSDVAGVLHYNGKPVGTVVAGVTEW